MSTAMPRMRTIHQCIQYLRERDPDTSVSEAYLRGLAKGKKVPCVTSGNTTYINLDGLLAYLNDGVPGNVIEKQNIVIVKEDKYVDLLECYDKVMNCLEEFQKMMKTVERNAERR